jgi:hypothetical protein
MRLEKIKKCTAKELLKNIELEDSALELFENEYSIHDYLTILIDKEMYSDAIKLLCHALPNREAVWWACICAKYHIASNDDELYRETVMATEKWVYDPSEKNRRLAEFYAEKGKYESAAAWAAAAAFWSGDSIVAENEPKVAPAEFIYAHAASGSIMTAISMTDGNESDIYKQYLDHGLNIAAGGNG